MMLAPPRHRHPAGTTRRASRGRARLPACVRRHAPPASRPPGRPPAEGAARRSCSTERRSGRRAEWRLRDMRGLTFVHRSTTPPWGRSNWRSSRICRRGRGRHRGGRRSCGIAAAVTTGHPCGRSSRSDQQRSRSRSRPMRSSGSSRIDRRGPVLRRRSAHRDGEALLDGVAPDGKTIAATMRFGAERLKLGAGAAGAAAPRRCSRARSAPRRDQPPAAATSRSRPVAVAGTASFPIRGERRIASARHWRVGIVGRGAVGQALRPWTRSPGSPPPRHPRDRPCGSMGEVSRLIASIGPGSRRSRMPTPRVADDESQTGSFTA
jgi:hypothetical protein